MTDTSTKSIETQPVDREIEKGASLLSSPEPFSRPLSESIRSSIRMKLLRSVVSDVTFFSGLKLGLNHSMSGDSQLLRRKKELRCDCCCSSVS